MQQDITSEAAETHSEGIKQIMEKGYTYPRALNSVVNGLDPWIGAIISEPNNLLAIEYMKALEKSVSAIVPFTVKRQSASHDSEVPEDEFASASYIRKKIIEERDISSVRRYLPFMWAEEIAAAYKSGNIASLKRLERVMLYKVRTSSPEEIAEVYDVAQGLEYRIAGAKFADSLEELLFTVKNKRYTMARIRRIILSLLIAASKSKAKIPFAVSIAKLAETSPAARRFAELEIRASDIYGLALGAINSAQKDYRAKIMIDME